MRVELIAMEDGDEGEATAAFVKMHESEQIAQMGMVTFAATIQMHFGADVLRQWRNKFSPGRENEYKTRHQTNAKMNQLVQNLFECFFLFVFRDANVTRSYFKQADVPSPSELLRVRSNAASVTA